MQNHPSDLTCSLVLGRAVPVFCCSEDGWAAFGFSSVMKTKRYPLAAAVSRFKPGSLTVHVPALHPVFSCFPNDLPRADQVCAAGG